MVLLFSDVFFVRRAFPEKFKEVQRTPWGVLAVCGVVGVIADAAAVFLLFWGPWAPIFTKSGGPWAWGRSRWRRSPSASPSTSSQNEAAGGAWAGSHPRRKAPRELAGTPAGPHLVVVRRRTPPTPPVLSPQPPAWHRCSSLSRIDGEQAALNCLASADR